MSATNIVEIMAVIDSLDGDESMDQSTTTQAGRKNNDASPVDSRQKTPDITEEPETCIIKRFLCPSGQKLYDFRKEPGFVELAEETLAEQRTLLEHNRLLTLFQAIRNTRHLKHSVAEIGSYRGGSAKFIARALAHFDLKPPIHVFDTFKGHPEQLIETLDGEHVPGLFSDTDEQSVRSYLREFDNIEMHVGTIEERCMEVADQQFSFVHIDVDIYSATVTCLNFFSPRLVGGGIFVVDDYGFSTCIGVKQAVDYFLSVNQEFTGWYLHTGQFVLQKQSSGVGANCAADDAQQLLKYNSLTARLLEQQHLIQGLQSQLIAANVTASVATTRKDSFQALATKLSQQIVSKQKKLDEFSEFRQAVESRPWLNWLVSKVLKNSKR